VNILVADFRVVVVDSRIDAAVSRHRHLFAEDWSDSTLLLGPNQDGEHYSVATEQNVDRHNRLILDVEVDGMHHLAGYPPGLQSSAAFQAVAAPPYAGFHEAFSDRLLYYLCVNDLSSSSVKVVRQVNKNACVFIAYTPFLCQGRSPQVSMEYGQSMSFLGNDFLKCHLTRRKCGAEGLPLALMAFDDQGSIGSTKSK
jgi:hypothetical protein